MAGRIIGGIVLMIIGAVVGLAFLGAYLFGWLWDPIADWVEILEDFLLIPAAWASGWSSRASPSCAVAAGHARRRPPKPRST